MHIILKTTFHGDNVAVTLGDPRATPGVTESGAHLCKILDVPEGITATDVLTLYRKTSFWPERFLVRHGELGDGKIVKGRSLTAKEAAGELGVETTTIRQLAIKGSLPGVKRGRDWSFASGDVDLYAKTRRTGRPPKTEKSVPDQ